MIRSGHVEVVDDLAVDQHAAAVGAHDAEHRLERRRLARGVAAEQADQLARLDADRDALEDAHLAVARRDVIELEQRRASVRRAARRSRSARRRGVRLAHLRCASGLSAQVGLDHRGVVGDLVEAALGQLLAVVERDDAVGDALDDVHVVLDHEDRVAALLAQARDQLGDLVGLVGVHPRRRLVEQQHPRAGRHRPRDLEAPAVRVGEHVGGLVEAVALQALAEEAEHVLGARVDLALLAARPRQASASTRAPSRACCP